MEEIEMKQDFYGADANVGVILDIPPELFKQTISQQILSPKDNNFNYLTYLAHKIRELRKFYEGDSDAIRTVNEVADDIYTFVIDEICKTFDISNAMFTDVIDDKRFLAENLYNFFIIRFLKGVQRFIYKKITQHRKEYLNSDIISAKRKDVTTFDIRKRVKHKDDVIIISNLNIIIDNVLDQCSSLSISNEEYFELSSSPSNYEAQFINSKFLDGTLYGDFVPVIFDKVFELGLLSEVRAKVNQKFIEKAEKAK